MIAQGGRSLKYRLPELRSAPWAAGEDNHCVATGQAFVRMELEDLGWDGDRCTVRMNVVVEDMHYTPTSEATLEERAAVHEVNEALSRQLSEGWPS
jgi:hypothetical protein